MDIIANDKASKFVCSYTQERRYYLESDKTADTYYLVAQVKTGADIVTVESRVSIGK